MWGLVPRRVRAGFWSKGCFTMGTHQLAPGVVLGRYELLLPIASGGMATVWVARSKGTRGFSKTVAVKTILPNLSDDPTFEQMFLDEASIASKIQHPNVAQIIDLGEQDEILYLAMEWVDGESLSTLSKFAKKDGNDIPLRVGLKIISQACAGIHAAHELRDDDDRHLMLVHRDVSPQNILISSSGIVKIVDFGVAKALGRTGETSAGQLKGKVPFMSPEQAKGGQVDRRTDIFALGIILYRISAGVHPFLDDTDIKTMRNIISRPPMPPRVKNPALPVELERVILKALQKDPAKRYATAAEMEIEIEAVLAQNGGPCPLDEVGTFVRASLGERDRKRRAAVRDAALKMDEGSNTDPNRVPLPVDSVSGAMLTKMQTPPSSASSGGQMGGEVTRAMEISPDLQRASMPDSGDEATRIAVAPDSTRLATPHRGSEPGIVSSPTLAAVAAAREPITGARAPSRQTKAVAISLAVVAGIAAGVILVAKIGGSASGTSVASKPEMAAATAAERSEPAATATSTAPSVPTNEGTAIDISDLPDQEATDSADKPKKQGGLGRYTPKPGATVAANPPTATATPAVPTVKPAATPTSNGMPAVQDPGF